MYALNFFKYIVYVQIKIHKKSTRKKYCLI